MISRYGMSNEFDMVAMESMNNQYLGGDSSLSCSFETQTLLDKKVVELVRRQHEKAYKILEDNIAAESSQIIQKCFFTLHWP